MKSIVFQQFISPKAQHRHLKSTTSMKSLPFMQVTSKKLTPIKISYTAKNIVETIDDYLWRGKT